MSSLARDSTVFRLAACLVAFAVAPRLDALDWVSVPAVSLGATQDDNFRLSVDDPRDVRQARLEIAADIGAADEGFEFTLNPRLVAIEYDDEREKDRDDGYLDLGLVARDDIHSWSFDAGFASEGTLTTEFQDTGFTEVDIDRVARRLATSWIATPNERGRYELAFAQQRIDYEFALLSPLEDYRYTSLSFGYTRALNQRSSLELGAFDSRLDPDSLRRATTTWGVSGVWVHELSSSLQMRIGIGWYRTRDGNAPDASDREPSPDLSVVKSWSAWSLRAAYRAETQPSSYGVIYRHETVDLNVNRRVSSSLTMSVGLRFADLDPERQAPGVVGRRYGYGRVNVDWRLSERMTFSFGVDSRAQEYEHSRRARSAAAYATFLYSGRVRRT